MIRITFVPKSSTNINGPSFVCQEVKLTNRLIEAKWETWRELTSFELGRSIVTGIGGGTQLERWNELLKVDLCFPKMIFSDLWRVDWKDFVEKKLRNSTNEMNQREAIMLWKKRSHDQAFSSSLSNESSSSQDTLNLKLERVDLYEGTEQEFEDWRSPTEHGSLPSRFPTPSALPAFSSVECVSSSASNLTDQVTPSSYTHQALIAGTRIKIDRLTFTPDPPPYYQSDREAEVHEAYHDKPLSFFPLKPLPRKGLRVLPDWNEEDKSFDHRPPAPELDPSHPNFDWKKLEGLYGVSYGPHGVELVSGQRKTWWRPRSETRGIHSRMLSHLSLSLSSHSFLPFRSTSELVFSQRKTSITLDLKKTKKTSSDQHGGRNRRFESQTCIRQWPSPKLRSSLELEF